MLYLSSGRRKQRVFQLSPQTGQWTLQVNSLRVQLLRKDPNELIRKERRRAFVHLPCTTESFPTLASPGCRSPWELVPRWEFLPRCHTMEIPRSLPGRTWLIRPTPYETSSLLRAALVCARVDGREAKGASVFSGFPEFATSSRMQDPDSSTPLEKRNRRLPEEGYCTHALS